MDEDDAGTDAAESRAEPADAPNDGPAAGEGVPPPASFDQLLRKAADRRGPLREEPPSA